MLVKHRLPKVMPSHTDTLPKESSVVEMAKQADTHQANRSLFPCPEDGCVKSYMTHGCLEHISFTTSTNSARPRASPSLTGKIS